jgi:hypothetical protein
MEANMVLHLWVIPVLILMVLIVGAFYVAIKFSGGSGIRTDGRTIVDKHTDDEPPSSV